MKGRAGKDGREKEGGGEGPQVGVSCVKVLGGQVGCHVKCEVPVGQMKTTDGS